MGIKKNIAYSSILTVSGYLFPLITFPYVTRVLGVNNIGICNFYDGVINYFILFSMLGMTNLGIREIAKAKSSKKSLRDTFTGLLSLNLITTAISIIALLICGLTIPKLAQYPQMIYIGTAKVLANCLLVEWFYKGLEEFRYITIRSLIVRAIYVISVFLFVTDANDYVIYFGLTTSMFGVNAILNLINIRKHVKINRFGMNYRRYLKPFLILGIYQILTSMYTTFNIVYLGFVCDEVQVGYYGTAIKLYTIILSFFTAFTGVMLPRMSSLLEENRVSEFRCYISKSLKVLYNFSVPAIFLTTVFAPFIINVIAGDAYSGAITPMRIVMPLMLIIGLEQVLIYQILFPLKDDKAIFINSIIGAVIGIIFNILLVQRFQSTGTAICWVCSEIAVLISAYHFVKQRLNISLNIRFLLKIVLLLLPVAIAIVIIDPGNIQKWEWALPISAITLIYFGLVGIFTFRIISPDKLRKIVRH